MIFIQPIIILYFLEMTEIGNVKVKTLIGDDIWSINKKDAVIDTAFFQHELNQAKKSGHAYLEHFTALCL